MLYKEANKIREAIANMRRLIFVKRDSVHPADDVFAPHLRKWPASLATSVERVMQKLKDGYLPCKIQGGKATWVAKSNGTPLAVIAQQWKKPKLFDRNVTIESIKDEHGCLELFVEFRGQDDPKEVFKEFQREMNSAPEFNSRKQR